MRIFEGSLLAFLAPSLKPFIACSSCSNGPNPATGNQPSAWFTIPMNVFGLDPPSSIGGWGLCTGFGPIFEAGIE
jgi:hypothetical protein